MPTNAKRVIKYIVLGVTLLLLVKLFITSSHSRDICDIGLEAARKNGFVESAWEHVKTMFNRPLRDTPDKYELAFYGKNKSYILSFTSWGDEYINVSFGDDLYMWYKNEYREDTKQPEENIIVRPYMIEKVHLGHYTSRLLFVLKHPKNEKDKNDVSKLEYEAYLECNGRIPENYPEIEEKPKKLIRLR